MITLPHNASITEIKEAILKANIKIERAEVLLTNLLKLAHHDEQRFQVPFDDIVTSIEHAVALLTE